MDEEIILKRLAFIKYLLNVANNQSFQPEPIIATSILSFHDALELFLHLCSEELDIKAQKFSFLEYWDKLKPELLKRGKKELTQLESMRRLNKSRVALKHHGTLPSKLDIESFRVLANTFFEENCKNVFGIKVKDISLLELISYKRVKDYLQKALELYELPRETEAMANLAIAFEILLRDYEDSKKARHYQNSPFFFGKHMTFLSSFSLGLNNDPKLSEFVDSVKESIEAIQKVVKILSLGIDYRRYVRFSLLTPMTYWISGRDERHCLKNK